MTDEPQKSPPPDPSVQPEPRPATIRVQGGGPIPPQVLAQILAAQGAQQAPAAGLQLMLPGIVQQQAQHWQGPYPPPEAVERYEAVLPGTLNRLITMAEKLQDAQIEQSSKALTFSQRDTSRGHWLGFVTTVAAMIGAVITVQYNAWVAAAFLSVPVMAVAKALIETTKAPTQTDIIKAAAEAQASPPPASKEPERK